MSVDSKLSMLEKMIRATALETMEETELISEGSEPKKSATVIAGLMKDLLEGMEQVLSDSFKEERELPVDFKAIPDTFTSGFKFDICETVTVNDRPFTPTSRMLEIFSLPKETSISHSVGNAIGKEGTILGRRMANHPSDLTQTTYFIAIGKERYFVKEAFLESSEKYKT